tara:strand:- start:368 stop:496 length:129 start_codon:yes stop_codon:yes gene_type:complete
MCPIIGVITEIRLLFVSKKIIGELLFSLEENISFGAMLFGKK